MVSHRIHEPATIVISGAGIVGLVLALGLKKYTGITPELYEQAHTFQEDWGAGMGMYPNGLRVIRDISPKLLASIRESGYPYLYRRWERHDGTEVVVAEEKVLSETDDELQSIAIRRCKLQKALQDAVREAAIPIHFNKRVVSICNRGDGLTEMFFEDGTRRLTKVLFGADGSRSQVREEVAGKTSKLRYTGVTCLMGTADLPRESRGICFPSSITTKCHGCFFPTSEKEQCFQFHFPLPAEDTHAQGGGWGTLSENVGKEECGKLAAKLREDGWDEKYLGALENVRMAIKIGFSLLEPQLKHFVYGPQGRVVLLGDAAHPQVPYIGQGAQQGIEDAGVIMMLLKNLCVDGKGNFSLTNFGPAMDIYQKMRLPRTAEILNNAKIQGRMQQKRADSVTYNRCKEELIKRDVFFHETMPVMFPGARYDYKAAVENVLKEKPILSVP